MTELSRLNPFIRGAAITECVSRTDECIAYDSRLIYMISGDLTYTIEDEKKKHLSAGMLLFIPAGTRYALRSQYMRAAVFTFDLTDERRDILAPIPPSPTAEFDRARLPRDIFMPFDAPMLLSDMEGERDSFISLCELATSAEGLWRETVSASLKLLLLKLCESVSENALPTRMVEALDSYIRENCQDEISNTEIGAIFGYHPFYVSRVLKEKKGITLRQYIISYRLKAARAYLANTKRTIAEIAEECGFTDASYFTKTFRQAFGMTPKEFRNEKKEEFI